jgi:wobble nucleotide-excising tRNase
MAMIEHIQYLRSVGRFDSTTPGAQLPFSKLTLLYAENSRGKTTIASILRSLSNGDPTLHTPS